MKTLAKQLTEFISNYVKTAGAKGVVVGMSGGKDSFVAAKLCTLALGNENVFGLIMPDGEMKDIEIAKSECEILKINYDVCNIEAVTSQVKNQTNQICKTDALNEVSKINIAPRVRMTLLYSVAANKNFLVVCTSNLSETMIGYSTKWGDGVGDFAPLADLTKTEVCELGLVLGLPKELVSKTPEDGLTGKSDEEKIGFSYEELDEFIREGKKSANFDKISKMHTVSKHKRQLVTKFETGKTNHFKK